MAAVEYLKPLMSVSRISRAVDMPRSTLYYRRTEGTGRRKQRISKTVEDEIIRIAGERTTYGYRSVLDPIRFGQHEHGERHIYGESQGRGSF